MKILFLAPANSIHTVRWVNSLVEREYNVFLVSLINHKNQEDNINSKVKVYELPVSGMKGYYFRHKYFQIKRVLKAVCSRNSLNQPDIKIYLKTLNELDLSIDMIIPTCLPFDTVRAALLYKQTHECRVIPVLYDMFAESQRLQRFKWNKKLKMRANLKLEEEMLKQSDRVLHMPSWTEHFELHWPELKEKRREIEHPLIVRPERTKLEGYDQDKIHIAYTGVVDSVVRNPQFVLNFISGEIFTDIVFHFYSLGSAQSLVEKAAQSRKNLFSHGQVSGSIAHQVMNTADLLLSIGNNDNTQMPSKIFEYMSTGKPILHFAQVPDDRTVRILKRYPMAHIVFRDSGNTEYQRREAYRFISDNRKKQIGFDEIRTCFQEADVKNIVSEFFMGGGYKLIYAGSLISSYIEPDYLLKLLSVSSKKLRIDFYSAGTACGNISDYKEVRSYLHGWVSHDELVNLLYEADIFVNIAEKSGRQISSKIFEYMSMGKPILHIYKSDTDVNLRYLMKYPLALCLKADDMLIEKNCGLFDQWCCSEAVWNLTFEEVRQRYSEMTPDYITGSII